MVASKEAIRAAFSLRLDVALDFAGAPAGRARRAWVATRYKVQVESVRKWLSGLSIPDTARVIAIAKDLGVSSDWLLSGDGPDPYETRRQSPPRTREAAATYGPPASDERQHDAVAVASVENSPGYVRLPLLNMEASMGAGAELDEPPDVVKYLDVAEWWAAKNLPADLTRVRIISARGDSMAGVIDHGDVVFVDTRRTHFDGEGLYVFNWNGRALIKRLAPNLRTGRLQILSANPAYPAEEISVDELDSLHISGRVAAWWTLKRF